MRCGLLSIYFDQSSGYIIILHARVAAWHAETDYCLLRRMVSSVTVAVDFT